MNGETLSKELNIIIKRQILLNGSIDDIWINNITKKNHCLIIKVQQNQNKYLMMKSGGVLETTVFLFISSEKNSIEMSKTGMIVFINTLEEEKLTKNFSF